MIHQVLHLLCLLFWPSCLHSFYIKMLWVAVGKSFLNSGHTYVFPFNPYAVYPVKRMLFDWFKKSCSSSNIYLSNAYFNSFKWRSCICSSSFVFCFLYEKEMLRVDFEHDFFYVSPFSPGECLEMKHWVLSRTKEWKTQAVKAHPSWLSSCFSVI